MSTEQEELKGQFASKATPVEKDLTVPGRTARGYEQRKGVDFLPRFLRSDINKKFLDATVDQLITNDSTRRLNSYYGSRKGLVNNPQQNFYQTSKNKLKEDYRFKPGIVTVNDDASTDVHITYDDIINRLEFLDADVSNLDSLFQDVNYIWRPIVNPDKLVNFSEYFWFQFDLPLCTIDGTFNPATDILGKVEFTVPAFGSNSELVLQNGMMISFGNASGPLDPVNVPKDIQPKGLYFTRPSIGQYFTNRKELQAGADAIFEKVKFGKIKIKIAKEYSLIDAKKAHEDLEARKLTGPAILIP